MDDVLVAGGLEVGVCDMRLLLLRFRPVRIGWESLVRGLLCSVCVLSSQPASARAQGATSAGQQGGGGAAGKQSDGGPPAINLIGVADSFKNEINAAMASAAASPDKAEPIGRLGMLYFIPAPLSAAECFERAVRAEPKSFKWRYLLGLSYAAGYRRSEAVKALREASELDPKYAAALTRLGDLLVASETPAAREAYQQAIAVDPSDARAHFGLGECARIGGQKDEALKHYQAAVAVAPQFAAAHGAISAIMDEQGQFRAAQIHRVQREQGSAPPPGRDPLYLELLDHAPGCQQVVELADGLAGVGQLELAIALTERVIRRDGGDMEMRHACGMLHGRRGNYARAAEHFRAVLEERPQQLETVLALGQALARLGDIGGAQQLVQEVINREPENLAAITVSGQMLMERGLVEKALVFSEKLVKLRANHADSRLRLAANLVCLGRYSEAVAQYQLALEAMPGGESLASEFAQTLILLMVDQQRYATKGGQGVSLLGAKQMKELASHFDTAKLTREAELAQKYQELLASAAVSHALRDDFGEADVFVRAGVLTNGGEKFVARVREAVGKGDVRVSHVLALALMHSGDQAGAEREWETLTKTDPRFQPAYLSWAEMKSKARDHTGAQAVLASGRKHLPESPWLANGLAWLLATCPEESARNGREAVKLATIACDETRNMNPEFLDTLATAYAAAGEFDKAVATEQEAIRIANDLGLRVMAAAYKERLKRFELKAPYIDKQQ